MRTSFFSLWYNFHKKPAETAKVDCGICAKFFHGACVNLTKFECDYYKDITSNVKYRCEKCSAIRRSSMRQQTSSPLTIAVNQKEERRQNSDPTKQLLAKQQKTRKQRYREPTMELRNKTLSQLQQEQQLSPLESQNTLPKLQKKSRS